MKFTHVETEESSDICLRKLLNPTYPHMFSHGCILARRSMLVMSEDCRYKYKHSISKDLVETLPNGETIERDRRVSFTFRGA